jgi:hypothetical protein
MEEITYADKTREAMQRHELARLKSSSPEAYLAGHNKGWNDGYKAGIREVVEWIEAHKLFALVPNPQHYLIYSDEWRAFKDKYLK